MQYSVLLIYVLRFVVISILHQPACCVVATAAEYSLWPTTYTYISCNGLSSYSILTFDSATSTYSVQILSFAPNSASFATSILYNSSSFPSGVIQSLQFYGYNTAVSNQYLLYNSTAVWQYQSSFSLLVEMKTYTNLTIKSTCYGTIQNQYLNLMENSSMTFVRRCIKLTTIYTCSDVLTYVGYVGIDIQSKNNKIFVLLHLQSNASAYTLNVYDTNLALLKLLQPPAGNSYSLQVNDNYILLYSCPNFYSYNMSSGYNWYSTFTIAATIIYGVKITPVTAIISANFATSILVQYSLLSGTQISEYPIYFLIPGYKIVLNSQTQWGMIWKPGNSYSSFFNFNQNYLCNFTDGCYCMNHYCFDVLLLECFFGGYGMPCANNPPRPVIIIDLMTNVTQCFIYNNNLQYCQIFCYDSCLTCSQSYQKCNQCSLYYEAGDAGNCELSIKMKALVAAINLVNVLRINKLQRLYFFIFDLQLYNYHKIDYDGIIREILNFLNFIQQEIWNFASISEFFQWLNTPYPLPSFGYYTNHKFYGVQRKDSQFFQNTKTYFLIYLPSVIVIFVFLNRIFYWLFDYKISSFLRLYSMWLYLVFIIVNQNIQIIVFLAYRHMQNLFSFDVKVRICQFFSILFIGMFMIICISISPLVLYLYGKLSKYFLPNMYRIKGAFLIFSIRFCFEPLIQSLIHAIYYQHGNIQIILLSSSFLLTFVFMATVELRYGIFITKMLFVCECLIELNYLLLNILIYIKNYIGLQGQITDLIEQGIKLVIYFFGIVFTLQIICAVIIVKKQNKQEKIDKAENQIEKNLHSIKKCKNQRSKTKMAQKCNKKYKVIYKLPKQNQQSSNQHIKIIKHKKLKLKLRPIFLTKTQQRL